MAKTSYQRVTNTTQTENVSFLSTLLFRWMNDVLKSGNERAIDETDFLSLNEECTACFLTEQLQSKWTDETANSKRHDKQPKLWKSVLKMLTTREAMILFVTATVLLFCRVLQPLLLGYLVKSLMMAELQHHFLLYGCALALGINELIGSLCWHQFDYRCEVFGIRISSAVKGLVYVKVTKKNKWQVRTSLKAYLQHWAPCERTNIVGQQLLTLLDVTCFVCLHTLLHVVASVFM